MGQFSWLYSDNGKQMIDDKRADSYLLVPPPFQEKYGKWIKEECYDGYGRMGGYDVYDLAAEWNREYLNESMLRKPKKEQYGKCPWDDDSHTADEWQEIHFNSAMERFNEDLQAMLQYKETNEYPRELRELGIDIACYDEQNSALPFPIKITSKPMEYGNVSASLGDPNQGWEMDNDENEEDW